MKVLKIVIVWHFILCTSDIHCAQSFMYKLQNITARCVEQEVFSYLRCYYIFFHKYLKKMNLRDPLICEINVNTQNPLLEFFFFCYSV